MFVGYLLHMITEKPSVADAIDRAKIGFLTAVKEDGQPQTSPVWIHRVGEEIVVYNRPTARRLTSIGANSRIALNLRGDRRGHAAVTLEGQAVVDDSLPPSNALPGYVDKYLEDIRRLGWTPESFAADYSIPLRITVTRVRAWGVDGWDESDDA